MSRSAATVYGGLILVVVMYSAMSGAHTSAILKYLCIGFLVFAVIYLGFAPTFVKSWFARLLHLPADFIFWSTNSRPFNVNAITETVFVGRLPRSRDDLRHLYNEYGVRAVVKMNEPWEEIIPRGTEEAEKLKLATFPTPDFAAPTLADVNMAVEFIIQCEEKGLPVFVHCNGGRGRSAVVAIAFLMKTRNWDRKQAYTFVKRKRKIAEMARWGGMLPQWKVLGEFEQYLKASA